MEENGNAPGTGEAKRSAAAPADPEVVDRPLRRRFSPSYKLRIVEKADRCTEPGEVGLANGKTVAMVSRELGISEQTYYRWRQEFGGMKVDQARRFKELEKENARLKRAVANLTVDKLILEEATKGNF